MSEVPLISSWTETKQRELWLRELEPKQLCNLISIELTCWLIEGMETLPSDVKNLLRKVHEFSVIPPPHSKSPKQLLDDTMAKMQPSHALASALSATVGTVIESRDIFSQAAIVPASVVIAIPSEQQISVLQSILSMYAQFGLPGSINELAVCNDWLEERSLARLKTPTVLA